MMRYSIFQQMSDRRSSMDAELERMWKTQIESIQAISGMVLIITHNVL